MIIAPFAWNLLPDGSVLTGVNLIQFGSAVANAWDEDPHRVTWFRGRFVVTAGVNDKIDFNDGASVTATLNAATYNSVGEFCVEIARAMNAVSTNWICYWLQGSRRRS